MDFLSNVRRKCSGLLTGFLIAVGACALPAPDPVDPIFPDAPAIPAQYRGAAFILDVSTLKRSISVSAPTAGVARPIAAPRAAVTSNDLAQFSLLGGDAVDLAVTGYVAGALGADVPGKVLITFDLQVLNKLAGIELITPTFPTPPSGVSGLQAFPIEVSVTQSAGGVGTVGNVIVITSPSFGAVVHSNNWDGAPHNFFNDVGCTASATDCFRYEAFGDIAPLGASAVRQVGFLIDPTVSDFRVKVILAADLRAVAPPAPAVVNGIVTSNIGPIANVTVSLSGGYFGVSGSTGAYSISGVATGVRAFTLSNVPPGCTPLLPPAISVTPGSILVVNFVLTCIVPTGSITGTITSSLGGVLTGITISATPSGGSATPVAMTNSSGNYSLSNVTTFPSTGTLTLGNLPSNCVNPGPASYAGLTVTGLVQNIVIACTAPPFTYPLIGTWGPITNGGATGRQVTLSFAIDMGSAPGSPSIEGPNADPLTAIGIRVEYDGARMNWASRTLLSPAEFDLGVFNELNQNFFNAALLGAILSTTGATKTGAFPLVRLTFNIANGFSGTIVPSVIVTEALAKAPPGGNFPVITTNILVIGPGNLVVP
ncbi:MAG: carboxypeptidase regulatory-like domain-containing protein [Phycisphaerae bacterium]|nr:carboxypeptidase regulatory-like domain-containing protein [Gemmatimonadaceae bacterium]